MRSRLIWLLGIALWLAAPFAFRDGRIGLTLLLLVLGLGLLVAARSTKVVAPSSVSIELDDAQLAEVLRLLDAGRKIEAIRRVREVSGTGLREAKAYVDTVAGS